MDAGQHVEIKVLFDRPRLTQGGHSWRLCGGQELPANQNQDCLSPHRGAVRGAEPGHPEGQILAVGYFGVFQRGCQFVPGHHGVPGPQPGGGAAEGHREYRQPVQPDAEANRPHRTRPGFGHRDGDGNLHPHQLAGGGAGAGRFCHVEDCGQYELRRPAPAQGD